MTFAWLRAPIVVLCLLLAACAQPVNECDLVRITHLPLSVNHRLLTVPVGINGQAVSMLVDTGAERTMITEETAERLKVTRDPRFMTRSGGVGGVTQSADARVDSFVLGGVGFPIDRVSVNRLGPGVPFEGILGADVLLSLRFDIMMGPKGYQDGLVPAAIVGLFLGGFYGIVTGRDAGGHQPPPDPPWR